MAKHPAKGGSALGNGARPFLLPVGHGGNSPEARRFKQLVREETEARGGDAALGGVQRVAIRQWAALVVEMDRLHAAQAKGEAVDLEQLGQLGDRADRQARRMGPVDRPKLSVRDRLLERAAKR